MRRLAWHRPAVAATLTLGWMPLRGWPRRSRSAAEPEDLEITGHVRSLLQAQAGLEPQNIHITTFRRTVRLSGFVASDEQKQQAERVVSAVAGVVTVRNYLTVRSAR